MADSFQDKLRKLRRSIRSGDMAAASQVLTGPAPRRSKGAGAPGDESDRAQREGPESAPEPQAEAEASESAAASDVPSPSRSLPAFLKPVALSEACRGVERQGGRGGSFWLIERTLRDVHPRLAALPRQFSAVIRGARQRWDELSASAALCKAAAGNPEDLLFMDIESCGLIPAPVFLIGTMYYRPRRDEGGQGRSGEGDFVFEQFLARNYAEEAAIVSAFAERLKNSGVLVTFNGKSFDMTLLRQRAAFHGVEMPARLAWHLDLLHESRKRWRGSLPNCRLQTLELLLCGRRRVGDIPGAMIAEAYHRFVKTGDARPIADIVHHNLLDLLTMGEVVCHLLTGAAPE